MIVKFESTELNVIQDAQHEWLLDTALVAQGYSTSIDSILKHLQRKKDELLEGKHYLRGVDNLSTQQNQVFWTKRGVVRLGFFIRSKTAIRFRDWAEDLVINKTEIPKIPTSFSAALRLAAEQQEKIEAQQKLIEEKTQQLDESKEWYTIKRYAKEHKLNWRDINWRALKAISYEHGYEIKKIFDGNYDKVNLYHIDVFKIYLGIKISA